MSEHYICLALGSLPWCVRDRNREVYTELRASQSSSGGKGRRQRARVEMESRGQAHRDWHRQHSVTGQQTGSVTVTVEGRARWRRAYQVRHTRSLWPVNVRKPCYQRSERNIGKPASLIRKSLWRSGNITMTEPVWSIKETILSSPKLETSLRWAATRGQELSALFPQHQGGKMKGNPKNCCPVSTVFLLFFGRRTPPFLNKHVVASLEKLLSFPGSSLWPCDWILAGRIFVRVLCATSRTQP